MLARVLLCFYCTYKVPCCYRAEHEGSWRFLSFFGMWHQVSLPLNCVLEDSIFEIAVLLTDWGFIKKKLKSLALILAWDEDRIS